MKTTFTFIHPWQWRGQPLFSLFHHGYVRLKIGRRFLVVPRGACTMEDLTAEEVGQLLGGN